MSNMFTAMSGKANLLDPQGLEANRNGEITESQNQRLNFLVGWGRGCLTIFALAIPMFFLFTFASVFAGASRIGFLLPFLVVGGILLIVLIALGGSLWKVWNNFVKLRHDRENRAIRQTQGQLSFDKNGYVFQAAERSLVLPAPEHTGGLLPGTTYRVYYLDETGFVLSAEETYPASPAQVRTALRDILARANNFTTEDLEHNRNNEVTSSQRMRPLGQAVAGAVFGLIALVIGIVFFFNFSTESVEPGAFPAMLIPALVLGIFFLVGGWMFVNAVLDIFGSTVEQVEGPGHKEKRTSGGKNRSTRYYYVIGERSLQVSRNAYTALIDGLDYRVYYLPRTKRLVSIEPLDVTPDTSQYEFNA